MAVLTLSQWAAIRQCWEYDQDEPTLEVATARMAEKYGFLPPTKQAASKHKRDEDWQRRGSLKSIVQAAHRKADRLVTSDGSPEPAREELVAGHGLPKIEIATQAREESEDKRAELLSRHRMEWRQVAAVRQEALKLRDVNAIQAEQRARLAKSVAETTRMQQDGERKAWGLDDMPPLPDFSKLSDDQLKALMSGKASM